MDTIEHLPTRESKQVIRNYRIRAYPNQTLQLHLTKVFGCTRFVYNHTLATVKQLYQNHLEDTTKPKPALSGFDLSRNHLTPLKQSEDHQWLYEVSKGPLQQSVHNLADAFKSFFRRGHGYPRFKSKYGQQSAYYPAGCFTVTDGQLTLAKTDVPIRLRGTRALNGDIMGCTVTKTTTGKYFVTLTVLTTVHRKAGTGVIGIDLGLKDYAVLSDGTKVSNPRHFLQLQRQLAHAQRMLAKKKKGSSNREKQRLKVARIHERICNARKDFLHKLSNQIVLENQAISMEDLKTSGMIRNHKLAKHIADASWSTFKQMILYKVSETLSGCLVIANSFFPSTQLCSTCGHKPTVKLKLSTREWVCPSCQTTHDRDVNAALNLELLGRKVLLLAKQNLVPEGKPIYLTADYGKLLA